jgi:hypothetical protein
MKREPLKDLLERLKQLLFGQFGVFQNLRLMLEKFRDGHSAAVE